LIRAAEHNDEGFGNEDGGDEDVLYFASDFSSVESGALGAVTAYFVWLRLAA
jgi:hypothetical protein